jgi:class 3 adenylate cyclase
VKAEFDGAFSERDGRVIPSTADVGNGAAVKLDATFLYADLAGSSELAQNCPWATTADIIRAFLECSTRLIRAYKAEIRSFDGDRVMGVFMGNHKNTNAVRCAREIFYTVEHIIGPMATTNYKSVRDAGLKLKAGMGVDTGTARAVRAGIRDNNDLIWIGRPPSLAAKLSDIREYPYSVHITDDVYKKMADSVKLSDGKNVWEERSLTFAGQKKVVYRTNWTHTP